MAGLTRKTSILFGNQGPSTSFAQFGSKEAGSPQTSQDPAVIQELSQWATGWQSAVTANNAPYLEDMNGFCYVDSYQITYLFQMGIPEWDSATVYFTGSVVQIAATGATYTSLQGGVPGTGAGQSGNTPPTAASNSFWRWNNPPGVVLGTVSLNTIPKVINTAPGTGSTGSATVGNSAISDNGTNVILSEPLQFSDGSVQTKAAQPGPSNQNVVTGSRAFNTIFQNSLSRPLFVSVSVGGANNNVIAYTDSSASPTTVVAQAGYVYSISLQLFFIVLPGNYYKVTFSGTLYYWIEWN